MLSLHPLKVLETVRLLSPYHTGWALETKMARVFLVRLHSLKIYSCFLFPKTNWKCFLPSEQAGEGSACDGSSTARCQLYFEDVEGAAGFYGEVIHLWSTLLNRPDLVHLIFLLPVLAFNIVILFIFVRMYNIIIQPCLYLLSMPVKAAHILLKIFAIKWHTLYKLTMSLGDFISNPAGKFLIWATRKCAVGNFLPTLKILGKRPTQTF